MGVRCHNEILSILKSFVRRVAESWRQKELISSDLLIYILIYIIRHTFFQCPDSIFSPRLKTL